MKLSEYASMDATGLAELIRSGQLSPRELLDTAVEALRQVDGRINAIVDYTYDYALAQLKLGLTGTLPFAGCLLSLKIAAQWRRESAPRWGAA